MDNLIGQRFSLISKSEIRYVGTLHEINPQQATIALEDVVSFGTEGRQVANFVPPSQTRYEYIVFRGSDVKDIQQAQEGQDAKQPSQPPDDPAILNSSRPGPPAQPPAGPPSNRGESPFPPQNYPPQGYGGFYPPPPPGQFGRGFGQPPAGFGPGPGPNQPPYGPPPGYFGPPSQGFPQGPNNFQPPPIGPPGQRPPPPNQQQAPPQAPASKQTTELPSEKNTSRSGSKASTPAPNQAPVPPTQAANTKPESEPAVIMPKNGPIAKAGKTMPAMPFTVNQRSFVPPPSGEPAANQQRPAGRPAPSQIEMDEASRQAREAVAAATAKLAAQQASAPQTSNDAAASIEAITKKVGQLNTGAPNARGRGNHRGNRGVRTSSTGQRPKMEIPQSDFDFESANAKFNKDDLVKEAIASGSPLNELSEDQVNGSQPARKDSFHSPVAAYNKSSSFFDDISSEAKDREDQNEGRFNPKALRGQEFKKNIETFGQGNVDSGYRGRGRGRGGYRGRGRGDFNRNDYYRGNSRGRGRQFTPSETTQT